MTDAEAAMAPHLHRREYKITDKIDHSDKKRPYVTYAHTSWLPYRVEGTALTREAAEREVDSLVRAAVARGSNALWC